MKIFITSIFVSAFVGIGNLSSQTISMDVIGNNGMYVSNSSGSMSWTLGEVTIDTYKSSSNFLTQGFHQPENERIVTPPFVDFFIPEGFSPNQDSINDFFVIRGINMYPKNSITIYNRLGVKIYEASPYQNKWEGISMFGPIVGGTELPVSTYFYLFDFGNGNRIIKGTIYLNR